MSEALSLSQVALVVHRRLQEKQRLKPTSPQEPRGRLRNARWRKSLKVRQREMTKASSKTLFRAAKVVE